MTNQFIEVLSKIKDLERRLSRIENYNQVATIKDGNGNTIIDSSGLNSLSNFTKGQILNASSPTVSSGSYADVSGSTLGSFTLTRSTNVLIYFLIDGYMHDFNTATPKYLNVAFVDNGSTVLQDLFVSGNLITAVDLGGGTVDYGISSEFASEMQFVTLSTGSHQFKLQAKIDHFTSGNTAELLNWAIGYIIFGN